MKMHTQYLRIDARHPQNDIIYRAARLIKRGEIVAFPTETVYGLGADAFQPSAVSKIFIAKGRPANQPLLVHISDPGQLERLVTDIPLAAQRLMQRFWPGPLAIILPASDSVPDLVRGGQKGVGIRMPAHPVALALINATGPLAAPSANRYGRPSPTSAEHVRQDLDGMIAAVIDAGETGAGLESTLIDLTGDHFRVLRRGGIGVGLLENCLGCSIEVESNQTKAGYDSDVKIVLSKNRGDFQERRAEWSHCGKQVGIVYLDDQFSEDPNWGERGFMLDIDGQGEGLYKIIREAEVEGIEILLFEPFESTRLDEAWLDRLQRAAAGRSRLDITADGEAR